MITIVPVSVVVPCFNSAHTLKRAIESIEQQTLWPLEVILVDDASTDGTTEICDRIQQRYPANWVKVIRLQVNSGASDARNAGWDHATGDYVAFLDSDDCWHPDKLMHQYEFMRLHPEVDVSGHAFAHGTGAMQSYALPPDPAISARMVRPWMVVLKNPFITPSIMLKRSIGLRFAVGQRHMEDHLLLMQLALRGAAIAYLPCALAVIFKAQFGDGGLSGDLRAMYNAERSNLRRLVHAGDLPHTAGLVLQGYVFLKYIRRRLIVRFRSCRPGASPHQV